ncbi:HpcH/HpaI aldolase/citrate lyase family protein [Defluviimonas salinarum]|uniref:HpcH/HpaI aldolase/citrate lyase family protein n=1 Tax=Defluviimonas salinarum TaxID=2992147 RepID=A0ABT3J4Y9_9RHOB|nr:HpcH/HpaI aldolase/citrate lyase family protein [Defluviimonas salinarum]MCW3782530.1 HpcH/HpaI aldolase/citrate lyase family protein [Defluviimonas salinarum]
MMHLDLTRRALHLGATLYMPAINPHARRALLGEDLHGAGSVVICLEDALHANDIARGLESLRLSLLERRAGGDPRQRTMVFVRPRDLGMARRIADMDGIETVSGMIVPKLTLGNGPDWFALSRERGIALMPTLETAEYFDPFYVSQVRSMFDAAGREQIVAVRLGGNDLLNTLGLRRTGGRISHDGPLGYVLNMVSSQLMSHGYPVAAPVFDIIQDLDTLGAEVAMDIERGFIGKTAIHPCQVPIIHEALKVDRRDIDVAKGILDTSAAAVFQVGGVMCEPATHGAWARRMLARAEIWGVRGLALVENGETALRCAAGGE